MEILERIVEGIGRSKRRGIYEASDGRHYCNDCRKMLRPGQEVIQRNSPAFKARHNDTYYSHYPECPS